MNDQYRGERVALLTQHGKEQVLAPILEPGLGCTIERVDGFDTDQLGTFTRDRPRLGSQIEAARELLKHLGSSCPGRALPGFRATRREPGLPCAGCGLPTQVWRAWRWRCQRCAFESMVIRADRGKAEPRECQFCNP